MSQKYFTMALEIPDQGRFTFSITEKHLREVLKAGREWLDENASQQESENE